VKPTYLAALALAACVPGALFAHPVTYPGNTMVMVEADARSTDLNLWHTFAPDHAVGLGTWQFKAQQGGRERSIANFHYNLRLKRWNLDDAQANVYLLGGIGQAWGSDFNRSRSVVLPGIQLDYETQQIFAAFRGHVARSSAFHHNFSNVQLGFSPYKAEYDELAPWFILDARYTSNLGDKVEVTPMLRLIQKLYFVEVGLRKGGKPSFTLMLNY
jgi:hypothetical protein